jgi:mRNA interferase RelE/StbE
MTRYKIKIVSRAKKQIENLPEKIQLRILSVIIDLIAKNPYIGKSLKGGFKGHYSYRVSDYRIIYIIVKQEILVQIINVMHRREAYR